MKSGQSLQIGGNSLALHAAATSVHPTNMSRLFPSSYVNIVASFWKQDKKEKTRNQGTHHFYSVLNRSIISSIQLKPGMISTINSTRMYRFLKGRAYCLVRIILIKLT